MNSMLETQYFAFHSERSGESAVALPVALTDTERQRCEVWTRVMGYHRPVASFNVGKKGEHAQRRFFVEARAAAHF